MKIAANSLLALSINRVGYLRTGRVLRVILQWALAMRAYEGPWPEVEKRGDLSRRMEAYQAHWLMSKATAWRDLEKFRAAFPDESDPTRLALIVLAGLDESVDESKAPLAADIIGSVVVR
jgi:hypothetical protein